MTEPTRVQFEYLPPIKVYTPGPQADRAGNALRDMQQTIAATLQAMRHSAESDHDAIALEVMAERLHEVTRKVRRAEREYTRAFVAEFQAREIGLHTSEESTHEDQPGGSP